MNKKVVVFGLLALVLVLSGLAGCAPKPVAGEEWKWTPGSDAVTYTSPAADSWSPTYTVYVKIVGGNDTVLFDGTVTLTSPQMMANEFLAAAITDKGLAQVGLDTGFVTKVGDYENDTTTNTYWMYYVNGEAPSWGVGEFRLRNGDYILLIYETYSM
jgi:Domain of unknown function (DUF4430)